MSLPEGWVVAPLECAVEILDAQRIPINASERAVRRDGKVESNLYPYYGATGQVDTIDDYLFDEPLILLGEDGVPFLDPSKSKAYLIDGKTWVNNHAHVIRAAFGFDRRYLCHQLNSLDYRGHVSGSTRLKLTQKQMRELALKVAPLNEQRRIADKLDAVLARINACRQRLDRIPGILKRFRQSVLEWAVSSVEEDSPKGNWDEHRLIDLCDQERGITYGVIKLGPETSGGVPCLRTSNVRWLDFELDGIKHIRQSIADDYSRTRLQGGEVLVNVRGTLGGVAVADQSMKDWNVSREVAVAPIDTSKIDPEYAMYCIGSDSAQRWLTGKTKGVAYVGINLSDLRDLPIRYPDLPTQKQIVDKIKALLASAETIASQATDSLECVTKGTQATLAKAFRGELVPQDPNDEPASELLARIKVAKAAAPKRIKRTATGKRGRSSKATSEAKA